MDKEKDWSVAAEKFDELQAYVAGWETTDLLLDAIAELPHLGELLEFGCGNGTFTRPASLRAEHVYATDISEYMVGAAKKKLKGLDNVIVQQESCYDCSFPDSSFDSVMMVNLIHVINDPVKALQEAKRVLVDRGRLILISFTLDQMSPLARVGMIYRYLRTFGLPPKGGTPFGLNSLISFVEENGFVVEEASLLGSNTKAVFLSANKE